MSDFGLQSILSLAFESEFNSRTSLTGIKKIWEFLTRRISKSQSIEIGM